MDLGPSCIGGEDRRGRIPFLWTTEKQVQSVRTSEDLWNHPSLMKSVQLKVNVAKPLYLITQ